MTAGSHRLDRATLASVPEASRPVLDGPAPEAGVVHLGLGAFHRAHQAVYTERAMSESGDRSWGIVGVAPRSRSVVDSLRRQDGLFTVLERQDGEAAARVVNAFAEVLHAPGAGADVVGRLASAETTAITLTITEKGYLRDPSTGRLATDDTVAADVAAIGAGQVPGTALGLLVAGLVRRSELDGSPVTVVSCDNLTGNGAQLAGLVDEFTGRLPGARADRVRTWLADSVAFPSSMVDRIVPATTDEDRAQAQAITGRSDGAVVVAERFRQWVIEDTGASRLPPWGRAGAELVADVSGYETAKLRVLNAAHSTVAYLGGLLGQDTIADALGEPEIRRAVGGLHEEVLASIEAPPGWDLRAYAGEVLGRFENRALGHRCAQVGADGSQKLPVRIVPTIAATREAGRGAVWSALAVAAWMRLMLHGRDDDGRERAVPDPAAAALASIDRSGPAVDVVREAGRISGVLPSALLDDHEVMAMLARHYADLDRHGVRATCRGLAG